jgi:hypothetical protein
VQILGLTKQEGGKKIKLASGKSLLALSSYSGVLGRPTLGCPYLFGMLIYVTSESDTVKTTKYVQSVEMHWELCKSALGIRKVITGEVHEGR